MITSLLLAEGLAQLGCGIGAGIAVIGAGLGIGKIGGSGILDLISHSKWISLNYQQS